MNKRDRIIDIVKVLFLAILLWFVITSWDDMIDRLLFSILQLDRESVWGWFVVASVHTIVVISIFVFLGVDLIDTFGIDVNGENICDKCKNGKI